jgi:peptidoglycan-associated lipoprotein
MTLWRIKSIGFTLLLFSTLLAVACGGKKPLPQPPQAAVTPVPQPPAPAPTITLRAQPATIERGSSTTLQWEAKNAATVTITPGVGDVGLAGNRSVTPASSVNYTATAVGPGGSVMDVARVTVNVPAAPPADNTPAPKPNVTSGNLDDNVKDILFEYDKAEISATMMAVLQANAGWLKANPNVRFTVEGHCDERGSEEYNLALGDRRANAVKEYLLSQGIAASRMSTVSYGEERPVCRESTEACYALNRRAHFKTQ